MDIEFTQKNIYAAAEKIWEAGQQHTVWAFHGMMGSGKTTFIHALCTILGVKDKISSPTFAIINEYKSEVAGIIYHMDWYRLKDEDEAIRAGIEDCLLKGNLILIEWPEKAAGLLPDNTFRIFIEIIDKHTRKLHVSV